MTDITVVLSEKGIADAIFLGDIPRSAWLASHELGATLAKVDPTPKVGGSTPENRAFWKVVNEAAGVALTGTAREAVTVMAWTLRTLAINENQDWVAFGMKGAKAARELHNKGTLKVEELNTALEGVTEKKGKVNVHRHTPLSAAKVNADFCSILKAPAKRAPSGSVDQTEIQEGFTQTEAPKVTPESAANLTIGGLAVLIGSADEVLLAKIETMVADRRLALAKVSK